MRRVWVGYFLTLVVMLVGIVVAVQPVVRRDSSRLLWASSFAVAFSALYFLAARTLATPVAKSRVVGLWAAAVIVFIVPQVVFEPCVVRVPSMEGTLFEGDYVLTRAFPKVLPERGDLVAFRFRRTGTRASILRVIGLPGDHLRIVARTVYINGAALKETYVTRDLVQDEYDQYNDNFPVDPMTVKHHFSMRGALAAANDMYLHHVVNGEVVVPAGKYFLLGDNREVSYDSRHWGFLDRAEIVGKPILSYTSKEVADAAVGNFFGPHASGFRRF